MYNKQTKKLEISERNHKDYEAKNKSLEQQLDE